MSDAHPLAHWIVAAILDGRIDVRIEARDEVDAPFGINRAVSVIAEIGLGELACVVYRRLCDAREDRRVRLGAPRLHFTGADARLRGVAIAKVLRAVGGFAAAVRWSSVDPTTLSRDAQRWFDAARRGEEE